MEREAKKLLKSEKWTKEIIEESRYTKVKIWLSLFEYYLNKKKTKYLVRLSHIFKYFFPESMKIVSKRIEETLDSNIKMVYLLQTIPFKVSFGQWRSFYSSQRDLVNLDEPISQKKVFLLKHLEFSNEKRKIRSQYLKLADKEKFRKLIRPRWITRSITSYNRKR